MPKQYFDQNSLPVEPWGICDQVLIEVFFFFFFLQKIFSFISGTSKNSFYKFSCKNFDIVYRSKNLASRSREHFRTKFNRIFFLAKDFYICFLTSKYTIYKFSCKNADIVFRSNFLASPRGIFELILMIFFFCKCFFHLFLGPLLCYLQVFVQ